MGGEDGRTHRDEGAKNSFVRLVITGVTTKRTIAMFRVFPRGDVLHSVFSGLILLDDAAGIVSAESESIGERRTYGALLSLVEGEVHVVVDVFVAVVLIVVDGRRHDVVLHRKAANDGFNSTGGSEEVTGHRLGGRDVEFVGMITEELRDGFRLRNVTDGRGRTVHVDVVDVFGLETGVFECALHHEFCAETFGVRSREVVRIGAHTGTGEFA